MQKNQINQSFIKSLSIEEKITEKILIFYEKKTHSNSACNTINHTKTKKSKISNNKEVKIALVQRLKQAYMKIFNSAYLELSEMIQNNLVSS